MRGRSRDPRTAGAHGQRRRLLIVALVLLMLGLVPTLSYARALNRPGAASFSVRTVDWLRDQGLSPVVNVVENWYYSRHAPADIAPGRQVLPATPKGRLRHDNVAAAARPGTTLPVLAGRRHLHGEATWYPHRPGARGVPSLYTGFFRPDPAHRSVVAGVAWIRATAVTAHLVPGTVEPGGKLVGTAAIPRADVPALVATFNSGWRLKDIHGGFYLHGRSAPALVRGQATAAIDSTGRLRVGQWGRDRILADHLVAARQNLALVVDHGHLAPGLDANASGQWPAPAVRHLQCGQSAGGHRGHVQICLRWPYPAAVWSSAGTMVGPRHRPCCVPPTVSVSPGFRASPTVSATPRRPGAAPWSGSSAARTLGRNCRGYSASTYAPGGLP